MFPEKAMLDVNVQRGGNQSGSSKVNKYYLCPTFLGPNTQYILCNTSFLNMIEN